MDARFPVLPAVLAGDTADVYVLRSRDILEKEGRIPGIANNPRLKRVHLAANGP